MSDTHSSLKRIGQLDLLRALAICLVVLVHTTHRVYPLNLDAVTARSSLAAFLVQCLFTIGRLGAPLFLLLSGYLLLDRVYDHAGSRRFYQKQFLPLLLLTELWFLLLSLADCVLFHASFSLPDIIKPMLFLQAPNNIHLWYLPAILGLYLFLPLVSNALKQAPLRLLLLLMAVALFYLFLLPEVNVLLQALGYPQLSSRLSLDFSGGVYGCCLVLGYFVRRQIIRQPPLPLLCLSGVCSLLLCTGVQLFSYRQGAGYNVWYSDLTLLLAALSIFLLFLRSDMACPPVIQDLSRCSFGIYLIHEVINRYLLAHLPLPDSSAARLLIVFSLSLILPWIIVHLVGRNKFLGKWLFFIK